MNYFDEGIDCTTISGISRMETCVREIPSGSKGVHESCLRAYHILKKAVNLLERGTPADVVIELVREMEGKNGI